jgi:antitoxin MazE
MMKTTIRRMGNSQGVLIPKPVLAQLGLENEVEMEVENDAIVLRRPRNKAREGWAEASKALAESGDDALVMGEFGNADDAELAW